MWWLLGVVVLLLVGCGGDSGTAPSPSNPSYPSITGTYSDAALWSKEIYLADQWTGGSRCEGYFTIDQQSDTAWSGRLETSGRGQGTGAFAGRNPCARTLATVAGTVTTAGGIRFAFTASSTELGQECQAVAFPEFSGTVATRQLSAQRTALMDCWILTQRGATIRRELTRVRLEERVFGQR